MNDRFKFRVWYIPAKNYLNSADDFVIMPDGRVILQIHTFFKDITSDCVIEQCTGLRDKNGNLIYEGDIIQALNTPQKYIISWGHHGFFAKCGCHSYPMSGTDLFEIVGNIHEREEEKWNYKNGIFWNT